MAADNIENSMPNPGAGSRAAVGRTHRKPTTGTRPAAVAEDQGIDVHGGPDALDGRRTDAAGALFEDLPGGGVIEIGWGKAKLVARRCIRQTAYLNSPF
jgi:hypothetical protein